MVQTSTYVRDQLSLRPGTWRLCRRDGVLAANFICPGCGTSGGLGHGTNHEVAADGTVSPSVVCDTGNCDFHEFIRLLGWHEAVMEAAG